MEGRFFGRVEGVEAFGFGGFKQLRGGGDEDDLCALEHIAGSDRGAQLQGVGPAEGGAVEELAGGFEDGRVERLLDHASGFKAQDIKRRGGVFGGDCAGALAPPDGRIDLQRRGGRDQLAVVFDGLHQADQGVGALLLHKEPGESRGFKEVATHRFPRSSSMASAMESPCAATGWKRCVSSGMPASARLSRMVVVG